ncbi:hypothetical protein [Flexivirga oryzae]|uniref:Uncharacterized protein n=1 Tax=Flexivirga oryzae TaxID=1794944 RepID=A0A839NG35_9MICO|nr:hypothetical protein [Flexivirga oryzae]MBB2893432.1 hypothetical protein [Flexivirga oryzae]
MATSDNLPDVTGLLASLRQRFTEEHPAVRYEPEDLSRLGVEAIVRREAGTARTLHSSGVLRFTGSAVVGNSANLDDVGSLSSAWQKAVTATGAALEDVKSVRGKFSASVVLRTQLMLTASPQPGSVVFVVEPKQSPMDEAEPHGQTTTEELAQRPLADRASERLVEFLAAGVDQGAETGDAIARQLRELGPRVGGAVNALALAIDKSNVTLDVSWREPAKPTRRASVDPSKAKFIREVVEGRGLDAEPETLIGPLQTISSRQRWAIETADGLVQFDASELPPADLHRWKVDDWVEVAATVAVRERGDGRMDRKFTATGIREAEPGTLPGPGLDAD